MTKKPAEEHPGAPAPPELDRLIHEPARLQLMSLLAVLESADFVFLQNRTGLTQGNLSTHMSRLEEAGYIEIRKEFIHRKPHTLYLLTKKGRKAFEVYRDELGKVLKGE